MARLAEFGFGGDAYPAEMPQVAEDRSLRDLYNHDEPDYEPGSAEYNFFYGNGQLHVSPHHDHDQLRSHAGVPNDHTGPVAVGYASVSRGRATWAVESNVSLRGLHRILRDYTKQVGWKWGGMTTLEGEPVDDDFAPKKSMKLRDNESGEMHTWTKQGSTAYVGEDFSPEMKAALKDAGYKVADYPGGSNMTDQMTNYSPMGEDLEQYNLGDNGADFPERNPDRERPTGTFQCPECGRIMADWGKYLVHRKDEHKDFEPIEDGKFPELNMDVPLPPHFRDRQPWVMPLASYHEASRLDDINDYAPFYGFDTDDGYRHYGAFLNGQIVGYAVVRLASNEVGFVYTRPQVRGRGVGSALLGALQAEYPELITGSWSDEGARLLQRSGFVHLGKQQWKWAAGSEPKDMIQQAVPFIYDVNEDQIVIGQPGQRTGDLMTPGKFTPGGIVEGTYEPGGKVVVRTMTNTPYSTRHLLDLWYWELPHMKVTGVEMQDDAGNKTKLAAKTAAEVGSYVKTLALADPAVWGAYQALKKAGGKVYAVGGAVRDALMNEPVNDVDLLVTGLPTEAVSHALENLPGRVDLTGKSFGVYRYKVKGAEVEVALPRTETSTGDTRREFDVRVDHNLPVEDDLLRRDFTINSMAVDMDTGRLVDPYGGADDIEHRRLRTTHPSSFEEDPTRMIRALVMTSRYGLHPTEQTRHEMAANAERLPLESADNKQGIIEKWFKAPDPARGVRLAHETGILKHIFPEVETHWGFDQNNPHHHHPLGEHLLNVLENVSHESSDPDLRLAALLHDVGKPASAWTNPDTGFNHYYKGPNGEGDDHETVGADLAERRLEALRWPKARTNRIKHLIQHHMFPAFSSPTGARKFLHRVGDEHADDLLTFRWADQHGKGQSPAELAARTSVDKQRGLVEQVRSAQQPTTQSALAINGNDIKSLGVKPGPAIGIILRNLTDAVVEDPALNTRDALLELAQEYARALQ
jgi:tRNA nucleotidyltransferase (CCA-adding enzyme)